MISTLFISKKKNLAQQYAMDLVQKQDIDPLAITIVETEGAIGIEDIRDIQKNILLAPFKGRQKSVILYNFETATIEAQNAVLKILEEPPVHTIIILTATTDQQILPTILSRCKIIKLDTSKSTLAPEELNQYTGIFEQLVNTDISGRFVIAQDLAAEGKEKTLEWLYKILAVTRNLMLQKVGMKQNPQKEIAVLNQVQHVYKTANTTNVNLRFLLENLFLSI